MGFFNDDPFDEVLKGFFGNSVVRRGESYLNESNSSEYGGVRNSYGNTGKIPVKKIDDRRRTYFVFDFSGDGEIDVEVKKVLSENGGSLKVLEISSAGKKLGEVVLPVKTKTKKMSSTLNHGILEVSFEK